VQSSLEFDAARRSYLMMVLRPEPKPPSWPPGDAIEANPTTKPLDDPQLSIPLKKPRDKICVSFCIPALSFLIGEMLKTNLNKNMIDVPYPSDAQRLIDILAGRTDIAILPTDQAMKYIQAQQLLPIVSLTDQRDPDLPAVPSIKEFGINDLTVNAHFFIVSNNPTNKENIALIQKTLTQVLNDPILNKPYKAEGLTIAPGSKTLSIEQLQKEISHLQTLIKKANMASE
jgi:tripartite-type tricarboxylate transporter receptor subunit TctC